MPEAESLVWRNICRARTDDGLHSCSLWWLWRRKGGGGRIQDGDGVAAASFRFRELQSQIFDGLLELPNPILLLSSFNVSAQTLHDRRPPGLLGG